MPTGFFVGTFFLSLLGIVGIFAEHIFTLKREERIKIKQALRKHMPEQEEIPEETVEMEAEQLEVTIETPKTISEEEETEESTPPKSAKGGLGIKQLREILSKAEVHLARKEFSEAEKLFIKILAFDENHTTALQKLAYLYLQTNSYQKAESLYQQLTELSSKNPGVYTNLGLALFNQKKFEESIEAYKKAIELEPNRGARYSNLGQVYFVTNEASAAIECFREAVKKEPRNIEFLYLLADSCSEGKEFAEAKKWYEKILDISPYDDAAKEEVRKLKALGY